MRRLSVLLFAALTLLVAAFAANAQYSSAAGGPPIGQVLVREGDYAVRLAGALGVLTTDNEVAAEDVLANLGIAPDSGWISDFPVTPDIIAELQASVESAAVAGRLLPTGKDDAVRAFVALNTELGLTITPGAPDAAYQEESAPAYSDQAVINDYYEEAPPVITYYAPPPDYAYMYEWDPFPFFWGGVFFPGFFILSDFDCDFGFGFHGRFFDRDEFAFYRHHHFDHDRAFITNHVFDRDRNHGFRVDSVSRRPFERTSFRPIGARNFDPVPRPGGVHGGTTAFNRASASRLLGGSIEHRGGFGRVREGAARSGEGQVRQSWSGSSMPSRTDRVHGAATGFNRGSGGTRGFQRPSGATGRPFGGPVGSVPSTRSFGRPMTQERSFNRSFGVSRQSSPPSFGGGGRSFGRSFSAPPVSGGRSFGGSFSAPRMGSERSFGTQSFGGGRSSGRSFSAPPVGGGRSFGGHSFGGGSQGFSGGRSGGSMGRGFGGFGGRR